MTVRTVHPGPAPSIEPHASATGIALLVNWFTPMGAPIGARVVEPAVYGTAGPGGRDLHLFLHRREDLTERRPGVVFVHGGGWANGSPGVHISHAHALASAGYVTASIAYRLTGEAPWPAAIDDVMAGIRWVRANAAELGLDPDRIAVTGGSAGGHLAAMAALLGGEDPSAAVQAAVIWYPAADLRTLVRTEATAPIVEALLPDAGDDELLNASPVGCAHAAAPPFLTMTGDIDPVTPLADIERFHERLTELGVHNELDVFEGRDHGFDYHPVDYQTCFARLSAFLAERL